MSNAILTHKLGAELKEGDVIERGWQRFDRIVKLTPYVGPLAELWDGKAMIARFEMSALGMTIEPQILYTVRNATT